MRYKFRGKTLDGKWIYGDLAHNYDSYIRTPEGSDRLEAGEWHKVLSGTVGQFTGLTDKNGKEIYEGDILNVLPNIDDSFSYRVIGKHVIEWWNGQFVFKANSTREDDYINFGWWVRSNDNKPQLKQVEVIGTIHDNPNLLESEG